MVSLEGGGFSYNSEIILTIPLPRLMKVKKKFPRKSNISSAMSRKGELGAKIGHSP